MSTLGITIGTTPSTAYLARIASDTQIAASPDTGCRRSREEVHELRSVLACHGQCRLSALAARVTWWLVITPSIEHVWHAVHGHDHDHADAGSASAGDDEDRVQRRVRAHFERQLEPTRPSPPLEDLTPVRASRISRGTGSGTAGPIISVSWIPSITARPRDPLGQRDPDDGADGSVSSAGRIAPLASHMRQNCSGSPRYRAAMMSQPLALGDTCSWSVRTARPAARNGGAGRRRAVRPRSSVAGSRPW